MVHTIKFKNILMHIILQLNFTLSIFLMQVWVELKWSFNLSKNICIIFKTYV